MNERNRRKAARIPFGGPVQIDTDDGPVEGQLIDVSRTGARIRILTSAIGYPPSRDITETALQVAATLPAHFEARLHYEVLGPLLHRGMNMMRISVPINEPNLIELGCRFDRPLSIDEITALGVALPGSDAGAVGVQGERLPEDIDGPADSPTAAPVLTGEPAAEEADQQARRTLRVLRPEPPEPTVIPRFTMGVSRRYRAYLSGTLPDSPPTLPCWSDHLNRQAVRLRVPRAGYEAEDVTGATIRFTCQFGNDVGLKLVEGPVHLWTGRGRVCGVELLEDPHADMLVTLAFARALRPAELRRLRLESLTA